MKRGPKARKTEGRGRKTTGRGKRGPAKTPTAKLKIHNSRLATETQKTKDKRPETNDDGNTVVFPSMMPERPAWCSYKRKVIWDNLIRMCRKDYKGLLAEIDVYVLARYCDLLAWYIDLRHAVAKEGEIKKLFNKQGSEYLSTNPKAALALRVSNQLIKLEHELYLTPATRQGLTLGEKSDNEKPNSLAAYLSRGTG